MEKKALGELEKPEKEELEKKGRRSEMSRRWRAVEEEEGDVEEELEKRIWERWESYQERSRGSERIW